jgi:ribosomal protein L9
MLFPKNLAIELTPQAEKEHKAKLQREEKHRMELINNRHKIAEELT